MDINKEKALLNKLYIEDGLSLRELAEKFKTSKPTIKNRLERYGIQLRPPGARLKEFKND